MDTLSSMTKRRDVNNTLEALPAEVYATYDVAMARIAGQGEHDKQLAVRVLCWITHARRPLSLIELQHALAASPGMTNMDPDDIEDGLALTSICAGLVIIHEHGQTLQLVRE